MKLKDLYYKLKYRGIGAGAIGVFHSSKKKKNDINEKFDKIAERTLPCYKTNDEVLSYIRGKYDLTSTPISTAEIENYKINYILSSCPELLSTSEEPIFTSDKTPTRKQMKVFSENTNKRFEEARNYPIEKLGLKLEAYTFEFLLPDGYAVKAKIIAEKTKDLLSVSSSVDRITTDEENNLIRSIFNDIDIYKGVTQEDINKRTKRFLGYAAAVIDMERITGI